jgi:hypothetical protein
MNPCTEQFDRLFNVMEAANFNYMLMRKQIHELDTCIAQNKVGTSNLKEKKTTMYHLNHYLDQSKRKQK